MYLKRLELTNFRNFLSQDIEPGLFFNIFTGKNAQGKTNILEAIYLCCTGKSFRTVKEKEIINWNADFSTIYCLLETSVREFELKVLLSPGQKKIMVNGTLARGYPLKWPGVVLFTPGDLVIVKGSPQERRHFFDSEIGPFKAQYGFELNQYQRVLIQRNNLLREIRDKRLKNESLQVWNEQLCRYGSKIITMRLELLKRFGPVVQKLFRELTGGMEKIDIRYLSSLKINQLSTEREIYNQFNDHLTSVKQQEIERAQSLIGPHRDDLAFIIDGNDARIYGSQGQQRTVILALKIAQIKMWHIETGEYPILLLDDVLFELDRVRQDALFDQAGGAVQVFITSTESSNININHSYVKKLYTVSKGKII
ncbi:MAG: DNA replication and repair protein RecF [Pelotomaculum sp. PtaB.Bin104]|nr:MAG: DNA replication and repair protein RecF [Pelotomaculum sp. PtaB.Bin104]